MRIKLTIKQITRLIPFFGLSLVLLLSPCKVRNFVEAELNIPQTEVSNKSKTTISDSSCSSFNVPLISASKSKFDVKTVPFNAATSCDFSFKDYDLAKTSVYSNKEREHLVSSIPLYILHQNFQVYL